MKPYINETLYFCTGSILAVLIILTLKGVGFNRIMMKKANELREYLNIKPLPEPKGLMAIINEQNRE